MNRNGLVFVSREPPKRVILYPTQDSSNQQQTQINGFSMRPKTAAVPSNHPNESSQQTNANIRLSRQQPIISAPSSASKLNEKHNHDDSKPTFAGSVNSPPRTQNPYYANPFFRPKVVTNQPSITGSSTIHPTSPPQSLTRESSSTNTTVTTQTFTSPSTTATNRGRQPFSAKPQNPYPVTNGRTEETDTQDDNRHWAHAVVSAPMPRRTASDERPGAAFQSSETNISNPLNSDPLKPKGTSATDIVISLMDTWRAPINPTNTSVLNIFTRNGLTKDDSTLLNPTSNTNQSLPGTPPYLSVGTLSTAANNNQNWKKALVANFQKNSRTNPTAKLFQSKQITAAVQSAFPVNNESSNQPAKPERTITFNGSNNERTFQANENALTIPSLARKTAESLRMTKQENNNSNVERATSLQVQPITYPNPPVIAPAVNKPEENLKPTQTSTSESAPHVPIPIPSALITAKPVANVEQQRAIITRVMIRRDFVKSTDPKPAIPSAGYFRSFIPPQSAKPGGLPVNNVVQPTAVTENPDLINANSASNRIHPFQRQQQAVPLSQKSLISFTTTNATVKEPVKSDPIPQQVQSNGLTNEALTSSSIMKISQSQTSTTYRSTSLSAANADAKKRREELMNKIKKRATSASAASQDGIADKDPFEIETEEDEAEIEDESARSSESDAETETTFALDPNALLSDKVRRVGNTEVKAGFIPSLFANVPPTIRFCTEDQRLEQLPLPLRKMMKWKMSTITPNIVKNTVIRSGFRLISVDEGNDWLGTWSRHMKPICFKSIREYQKVNHFPGSFQIGRKDRLWRNLSHMQAVHSRREFDFVPQTFVLPADFLLFKRVFDELTDTKESKWIIKPPASARGQGIRVISKIEHVPKKRPVIVQKYIANPYLINGHKFDLRLYVYVTSHDPLRIYLFDDGLTRFASRKYSSAMKSLSDRFMHLTNYSINRYNSEYKTNNDSAACVGHKWSLKALWAYLKKRDVDVGDVLEKIKDLIVKTIISADSYVNVLTKANVRRKYCVHELFGFDVILDEQCKPYIVEVNISPSLHSNSPLDVSVKGAMIRDLLNLSGFMIPDRRDILYEGSARRKPKLPKSLIFDRRILPQSLSTDEKVKHQYFSQRYSDEQARKNILDVLTPDDIRILLESEDEFARRGSFERIFPTNQTKKYLKYFETPRYYNLLLNEWILKYTRLEERGIALLNTFCKRNIHLQNPAIEPNHMWTQYQKLQGHLSHRDNDNMNNS